MPVYAHNYFLAAYQPKYMHHMRVNVYVCTTILKHIEYELYKEYVQVQSKIIFCLLQDGCRCMRRICVYTNMQRYMNMYNACTCWCGCRCRSRCRCVFIFIYRCVHAHVYVHVNVAVHVYVYVDVFVYVSVYLQVHVDLSGHKHVRVHIYVYV